MSTTDTGSKAERRAADFLKSKGYEILAMNWRRPRAEIDIVAAKVEKIGLFKRSRTIYFVEVKYRRRSTQGSGLDYITPAKLKQMKFAAELWASENDWTGAYELAAVEVAGEDFTVTDFIEKIDA